MDSFAKLSLYCFLLSIIRTSSTFVDIISPGKSLRDNGSTIVSNDQTYELGFFSPGRATARYVGIWYKKVSTGTVVWVANRESPIWDHSGVLNFTNQGVLVLLNSTRHVFWSSNTTTRRLVNRPIVQLLDSGNLIVRNGNDDNPENYLWQSFDHPGDTCLPGMKLGINFATGLDTTITSWKSLDDPDRGEYSYCIDHRGFPQLLLKKGNEIQFRAGSWNGLSFTGTRRLMQNSIFTFEFMLTKTEVYYRYELVNKSVISRLVLNASGVTTRLIWIDQQHGWVPYLATGKDQCNDYANCGPNAKCNTDETPVCSCLDGFEPKSARDWSLTEWSGGCVRKAPLACSRGEGFEEHDRMKLPDTSNSWYNTSMNLKECRELCLKNCSCIAYANTDIRNGGSGCLHWFNDLIDMREFAETGQALYVRMSASYIGNIRRTRRSAQLKRIGIIICVIVLFTLVLVLGWTCYIRKTKRKNQDSRNISETDSRNRSSKQDLDLPTISLDAIIEATDNFSKSNKLGEGGFGPVYKGILADGQEIAVKRLSEKSGQGLEEFKNEVLLIAKLQHRNLVKLLGCCIEGDERMLVYEYMTNKSLDYFIFDEKSRKLIDWPKRLSIIAGTARGLLYLHQDSRLRIIHRDLKASNVLLDKDMYPKISDFGMARTFGADQIEANTNRVVGTYGYMSPEYAIDGLFSTKSDVFSFGILVLEIISGKKNRAFNHPGHHHNLAGHAWILWNEEKPMELISEFSSESSAMQSKILRCIHVGLLCVQQRPEDRPSMSSVVVMLETEIPLAEPKQPGFFTERCFPDLKEEASSSNQKSSSSYAITESILHPR